MKIAICDDDARQIEVIEGYIKAWAEKNKEAVTVETFLSAERFLFHCTSTTSYDLLFLDIRMDKITGMELAERIRETDTETAIVFVTADRDFVFRGYEVEALYYLIKPIDEAACEKCLDKVKAKLSLEEGAALVIQTQGKLLKIKHRDLIYLESLSHYLNICTTQGEYKYRKKIADIEEELKENKNFIRIHRSFIVNLEFVYAIEESGVVMENGVTIPISRQRWRDTHKAFVKFHASI